MSHSDITLQQADGVFLPSQGSVAVSSGDTVSFTNNGSEPVELYFSPDAVASVIPTPATPASIAPGATVQFTFSTSAVGAYSVFFNPEGAAAPASFPSVQSTSLLLEIDSADVDYGVVIIRSKSGS